MPIERFAFTAIWIATASSVDIQNGLLASFVCASSYLHSKTNWYLLRYDLPVCAQLSNIMIFLFNQNISMLENKTRVAHRRITWRAMYATHKVTWTVGSNWQASNIKGTESLPDLCKGRTHRKILWKNENITKVVSS